MTLYCYTIKRKLLTIHSSRFTNNVLSTAQQVWLRKLGGAKPAVTENASGIISAGRAKRSGAQPDGRGERWGCNFNYFVFFLFQNVLQ